MFWENESFAVKFVGIWPFDQKDVRQHMYKRKFCTIALRIKSNAIVEWNGKSQRLTDGMLTFVPQNLEYSRFAKYDNMIAINFETYNYVSQDILALTPQNFDGLLELFKQALNCWQKKEPGYQYHCTAILCEILAMIQGECSNRANPVSPIILESTAYLHDHFADCDCTVQKLADMSHISVTYFRKLFEKSYSVNPKKYINTLRIEHAARLLVSTDLSISEISERTGFNDPKHLATIFKTFYGTSPSLFRKEDAVSNRIELLNYSPEL